LRPSLLSAADALLALRERLKLSVAAFFPASCAPTGARGKTGNRAARPHAQAALLIRLVERNPDTVVRPAAI
jgi:DNA-binding transcriptional regulator YiaG